MALETRHDSSMTKHPSSFLFSTWEGGGNVPPVLGVAARLVERGHRVRILAEPCLEQNILEIGAYYIPFKQHFIRTDRQIDLIQDSQAKPLTLPSVENILTGPALDVAHETLLALESEHTDVVVADFMMLGSLLAAEAKQIKRVALFHMPEYLPGKGRPPGGLGLLPSTSHIGQLRDFLLTRVFNRVLDQYLPELNNARIALSLSPYTHLTDIFHQADLRLIQTCKAFDAPINPAPANVRYVGPILDDPIWSDLPYTLWPESDSRPLVLVSLSSTYQNQKKALQTIITAVKNLNIRCLVTLGPSMKKEYFNVPENVILSDAIPHSKILPFAHAVVTHAGHGTVMRALASGLPLVCMPMGRDQIDNATLVAHHGAGIKLSAKASVKKIYHAIKCVLEDPHFTEKAQQLQHKILADANTDKAIHYIEGLT